MCVCLKCYQRNKLIVGCEPVPHKREVKRAMTRELAGKLEGFLSGRGCGSQGGVPLSELIELDS